jgi:hypothetical protein
MGLFKLIFAFTWIIPVFIYYLQMRGDKKGIIFTNIFYKKLGDYCYNCNSHLGNNNTIFDRKENFELCVRCSRDFSISEIESTWFRYLVMFKKFLLSDKSNKLVFFLLMPLTLLFVSLFIGNRTLSDFASILNSTCLLIYWILQIIRNTLNKKSS